MAIITYAQIREKMEGEPFPMEIADEDEGGAVVEAVNQGIGSHLEVCNAPDRGDNYGPVDTMVGDKVFARKLSCVVSVESFPTLLRRLCGLRDKENEAAESLLNDILNCLGFTEEETGYGNFDIVSPVDEE